MILIDPRYVNGVRKYFPRMFQPGSAHPSNQPHPGRPPYKRRVQYGVYPTEFMQRRNLAFTTPGARPRMWLVFSSTVAFSTNDWMVILTENTDVSLTVEWIVDASGPPLHTPDVQVDILSTDTPTQVRDKTLAAMLLVFSNEMKLYARDVVAGDDLGIMGVPTGPAIIIQDTELEALGPPHMVVSYGFSGDPAFPDWPVLWFKNYGGGGAEDWEGMLERGQLPVYALPGIGGERRAHLPIGDELPTSTFGEQPEPPL